MGPVGTERGEGELRGTETMAEVNLLAPDSHICAGPYGGGVRWVRTNPPPVATYGKQKLEPNHFVAVQDLIERSELKVSLKH